MCWKEKEGSNEAKQNKILWFCLNCVEGQFWRLCRSLYARDGEGRLGIIVSQFFEWKRLKILKNIFISYLCTMCQKSIIFY